MYQRDAQHTGQSQYPGPQTPDLAWRYDAVGAVLGCGPVVGPEGAVYVGDVSGTVHAVTRDGSRLWTAKLADTLTACPVVTASGALCVATEGHEVCLLGTEGEVRWRVPVSGAGAAAPLTMAPGSGVVYIPIPSRHTVVKLSTDGQIRGQDDVPGATPWLVAITPDGACYIGSGGDHGGIVALKPDATQWWASQTEKPTRALVVDREGRTYAATDGGMVHALSSEGHTLWQYDTESGALGAALDNNRRLYVTCEDGSVHAVSLGGVREWRFGGDGTMLCEPAVDVDGNTYVASISGSVYCLRPDGSLKWRYSATAGFGAGALAMGGPGRLYAASVGGGLYAFGGGQAGPLPTGEGRSARDTAAMRRRALPPRRVG
jgi:outer membrane protein assembly factor BamB